MDDEVIGTTGDTRENGETGEIKPDSEVSILVSESFYDDISKKVSRIAFGKKKETSTPFVGVLDANTGEILSEQYFGDTYTVNDAQQSFDSSIYAPTKAGTTGALEVYGASGPTWLPAGATGSLLHQDDINGLEWLPKGATGNVLASGVNDVEWVDPRIGMILPCKDIGYQPQGWLVCNGGSLLVSDYPELAAFLKPVYGGADADHFNLPPATNRLEEVGVLWEDSTVAQDSSTYFEMNLSSSDYDYLLVYARNGTNDSADSYISQWFLKGEDNTFTIASSGNHVPVPRWWETPPETGNQNAYSYARVFHYMSDTQYQVSRVYLARESNGWMFTPDQNSLIIMKVVGFRKGMDIIYAGR